MEHLYTTLTIIKSLHINDLNAKDISHPIRILFSYRVLITIENLDETYIVL